jgi:gliding motility-associated lipoprotein GldD
MKKILLFLLPILIFASCNEQDYTPKPRAYFRIDLPKKGNYQTYSPADCPYQFEYPAYAKIERDSTFFDEKTEDPCWLNISFNSLGGMIHVSYKPITKDQTLFKLSEDAHKMSFKHTVRADYIEERVINNRFGAKGILYDIGGNAASNVQFFLTDSTNHYLRGALYFSAAPNADSLEPVIDFVRADMVHIIESFKWK